MHCHASFRYVGNTRIRPTYDTTQSFTNTMTERTGGDLFFTFTRRIVSADTSGQDINLNVCLFLIRAWGGTVTNFATPAMFGVHSSRGGFTDQMCLQQCDRVSSGKFIISFLFFSHYINFVICVCVCDRISTVTLHACMETKTYHTKVLKSKAKPFY